MAKAGFVSPSVVSIPWDLHRLVPPDASAIAVTLNNRNGLPGEADRALAELDRAVDVLADEGAERIVLFGIPNSARQTFAGEAARLAALSARRGVPVTSSLLAVIGRLRARGATRPLLVTQYAAGPNGEIAAYFGAAGLAVAGAFGMGAGNAAQVNATAPGDYEALAERALLEHPDADSVFFSARGNLYDVARRIEQQSGRAVVEQIEAAVWWAFERIA